MYTDCFRVDLIKLRELFDEDTDNWKNELEMAQLKAKTVTDRATHILREKQGQMQILMEEM